METSRVKTAWRCSSVSPGERKVEVVGVGATRSMFVISEVRGEFIILPLGGLANSTLLAVSTPLTASCSVGRLPQYASLPAVTETGHENKATDRLAVPGPGSIPGR